MTLLSIFSSVFKTMLPVSFSVRIKLILFKTLLSFWHSTGSQFLNTFNIKSMSSVLSVLALPPCTCPTHFISTHHFILSAPFLIPSSFAFLGSDSTSGLFSFSVSSPLISYHEMNCHSIFIENLLSLPLKFLFKLTFFSSHSVCAWTCVCQFYKYVP